MFARLRRSRDDRLNTTGLAYNTFYWISISVGAHPQELVVRVGDFVTLKYATFSDFYSTWEKF